MSDLDSNCLTLSFIPEGILEQLILKESNTAKSMQNYPATIVLTKDHNKLHILVYVSMDEPSSIGITA